MTVEVLPIGVTCNLRCTMCYENAMRDEHTFPSYRYDMDAMKRGLEDEMRYISKGEGFTVFGGEPLLMPIKDLEELWAWGFKKYGANSVQTNAALITAEHVALFKKYNVNVGASMEGPDELNDGRWAGTLEKTRAMTAKSQAGIELCLDSGVPCSLITTLTRHNATPDRLPRLLDWLRDFAKRGMQDMRIHLLEVDDRKTAEDLSLNEEDAVAAMLALYDLYRTRVIRIDLFNDMLKLLRGQDGSGMTCIWAGCDPWTTSAVRGVGAHGERTNCGRTNKDGKEWQKAENVSYMRSTILHETPYEDGGCKDCRFFLMCRGQCPGEAIDGDWRNRSANCRVWFRVFEHLEAKLIDVGERPISLDPNRKRYEEILVHLNRIGQQTNIATCMESVNQHRMVPVPGGLHGDVPHGDHGDA